jgi:predicted murein hydrolase (TIGR00659 family)
MSTLQGAWNALSGTSAFGVGLTLVCYQLGLWMHRRASCCPILNPVLIAIVIIIVLLLATGINYETYFRTAAPVDFLLGPATVALAVPLYKNIDQIRRYAFPIIAAVTAGGVTAATSAVAIAWTFGGSSETVRSIAPKSVTTPIAIGVSAQINGIPELTAVLVVATGVLGAVCVPGIAALVGIRCPRAVGLAAGVAGHGIATARMLSLGNTQGAFAGLAMGLCGLFSAILIPIAFRLLAKITPF